MNKDPYQDDYIWLPEKNYCLKHCFVLLDILLVVGDTPLYWYSGYYLGYANTNPVKGIP